jgi:hypothetical protein
MVAGIFDAWAKRYIKVVLSDSDVHAFDAWHVVYAVAWLNGA